MREGLINLHLTRPKHSRGYPVYAVALFCPICEEVWARIYPNSETVTTPMMAGCSACKWGAFPGSLLPNDIFEDAADWDLLDYLPFNLLEREFNLTLEAHLHEQSLPSRPSTYASLLRSLPPPGGELPP